MLHKEVKGRIMKIYLFNVTLKFTVEWKKKFEWSDNYIQSRQK